MNRSLLAFLVVMTASCALEERSDFLIGRICSMNDPKSCDDGQKCLPHQVSSTEFSEFRCRDKASFEPIEGRDAPLAYCDDSKDITCPEGMVCNADRIRLDATQRRLVCKFPNDVFAPPYDGGP